MQRKKVSDEAYKERKMKQDKIHAEKDVVRKAAFCIRVRKELAEACSDKITFTIDDDEQVCDNVESVIREVLDAELGCPYTLDTINMDYKSIMQRKKDKVAAKKAAFCTRVRKVLAEASNDNINFDVDYNEDLCESIESVIREVLDIELGCSYTLEGKEWGKRYRYTATLFDTINMDYKSIMRRKRNREDRQKVDAERSAAKKAVFCTRLRKTLAEASSDKITFDRIKYNDHVCDDVHSAIREVLDAELGCPYTLETKELNDSFEYTATLIVLDTLL